MLSEIIDRLQVLDESMDEVNEYLQTIDSRIDGLREEITNLIRESREGPLNVHTTSEEESSER